MYSQFVIFPISDFNHNRPNLLLERYCTYHVFLFIECPIGHFGRNCSNKCSPPNFGYLCGQEYPSYCKTCHYIFGCTITTETKGKLYEFKLLWVFCFQRKTYFFFFLAFLIRVCCLQRKVLQLIYLGFFTAQLFFLLSFFTHFVSKIHQRWLVWSHSIS